MVSCHGGAFGEPANPSHLHQYLKIIIIQGNERANNSFTRLSKLYENTMRYPNAPGNSWNLSFCFLNFVRYLWDTSYCSYVFFLRRELSSNTVHEPNFIFQISNFNSTRIFLKSFAVLLSTCLDLPIQLLKANRQC